MVAKNLISSFVLLGAMAVSAFGQNVADVVSQKSLKEAYAGKFLIGAANDLTSINDAEIGRASCWVIL